MTVKATTGKAKADKVTEAKTIVFTKDKETKGAVRFVAEGLEGSNIYFKKTELADLGLEDADTFTMTLTV